jgi:hypothetical protein
MLTSLERKRTQEAIRDLSNYLPKSEAWRASELLSAFNEMDRQLRALENEVILSRSKINALEGF